MSLTESTAASFDVFICHNSADKPAVRKIVDALKQRGVKPWFDEEAINPGDSWQTIIGKQLSQVEAAAVFVGPNGIAPWQDEEIQGLLIELKKRHCRLIPVILDSTPLTFQLPWTLRNRHWVDFRKPDSDPIEQLVKGITGVQPGQSIEDQLLPLKEKQIVELRLLGNRHDSPTGKQHEVIQELESHLQLGKVKVTREATDHRKYLELRTEDADKIYSASTQGRLNGIGIADARLYASLAVLPSEEQRARLLILLDRVQAFWVDGVLRQSLHNEVLLALGKRPMAEAVDAPWKQLVEFPKNRRELDLQNGGINSIFDASGLLLILGEPGSGKTTTLLELASDLIRRAKKSPTERVPIVLNLSSWRKGALLEEWIAGELSSKYRIPRKIARDWVEHNYLVPLLDGLDELPTAIRPDCVAAINNYVERLTPAGLVVCCRLLEYQWLPERLKLDAAVLLEPLTPKEVRQYVEALGPKWTSLQHAFQIDPTMQELAQTPLMLDIMSLAYEGASNLTPGSHASVSPKERRKQILQSYIDRMFERKRFSGSPFPKVMVITFLTWLARRMKEHSQTVFMVEELQPNWLTSTRDRLAYGLLVALAIGNIFSLGISSIWKLGQFFSPYYRFQPLLGFPSVLAYGLISGLGLFVACRSTSPIINGVLTFLSGALLLGAWDSLLGAQPIVQPFLPFGIDPIKVLVFGIFTGVLGGLGVGMLDRITPIENMSWRWKNALKGAITGSVIGLVGGFFAGTAVVLTLPPVVTSHESNIVMMLAGAILGFLSGTLINGLFRGLTDTARLDRLYPNQGIHVSLKNAALGGIFPGLLVVLFYSLAWLFAGGVCLEVNRICCYSVLLPLRYWVDLIEGARRW